MYPQSLLQVREFHRAFGHPVSQKVNVQDKPLNDLRLRLIAEELVELKDWLALCEQAKTPEEVEVYAIEVLDALADIQYVLDGAYLAFGMAAMKSAASSEVHRSNMSKLGEDGKPIKREDGKILKGPNYSKPNLKAVFEKFAK